VPRSPKHARLGGLLTSYEQIAVGRGDSAPYQQPTPLHHRHRLFVAGGGRGPPTKRRSFPQNLTDVVKKHSPTSTHVVAFWPADSDPCIQVADYANWAIQRRWEQGDPSAHEQIGHLIRSVVQRQTLGRGAGCGPPTGLQLGSIHRSVASAAYGVSAWTGSARTTASCLRGEIALFIGWLSASHSSIGRPVP